VKGKKKILFHEGVRGEGKEREKKKENVCRKNWKI
jgi:hypothetical protein